MQEKEINAGYEIIQKVSVGINEVVLGECLNRTQYVTWIARTDADGNKEYDWGNYFLKYKDALADLGRRVKEHAGMLPDQRLDSYDRFYRAEDCMRDNGVFKRGIFVLDPACLSPAYRLPDFQLFFITEGCKNGFVKGIRLADEMKLKVKKEDIIGVPQPSLIPEWAVNAAKRIQNERKRRSPER